MQGQWSLACECPAPRNAPQQTRNQVPQNSSGRALAGGFVAKGSGPDASYAIKSTAVRFNS